VKPGEQLRREHLGRDPVLLSWPGAASDEEGAEIRDEDDQEVHGRSLEVPGTSAASLEESRVAYRRKKTDVRRKN
jgi:hypothetical protein